MAERAAQSQAGLDVIRDRRTLRDKKRERLQASFEQVLLAATTLQDIIHARRFTWEGETVEQRDAKLQESLRRALQDLDRAQIHLRLESGTAALVDRFGETFNAFQSAGMLQHLRERDKTEAISWQQIQEAEQQVEAGVRELKETMLATLAELEQPISG